MRVTIGDLDYFHAKEKVNCFNPDVMKISSYHKQLGDTINFVKTQDDVRRPYDLYYVIKEDSKTPNPPLDFFTNKKIRWGGNAYRTKVNGKMTDAILGCRPDYLLYPEYNTKLERAEHIRFFNNKAQLLKLTQDYHNTFKTKRLIITDKYMGYADKKDIITVLKSLEDTKNLYFLKPIHLQKILDDEELKKQFLKLHYTPGANFKGLRIKQESFQTALDFLLELKKLNPETKVGHLIIDYSEDKASHGICREKALEDFNKIKRMIITGKKNRIRVKIMMPRQFETPYSYIFSVIAEGTLTPSYKHSGIEFITAKFTGARNEDAAIYGNRPHEWHDAFRDLLRHTYTDSEFLLWQGDNKKRSENDIPGKLLEEEFKYGI